MSIEVDGEMLEVFDAHTHLNHWPSKSGSQSKQASTSEFNPRREYSADMMIEDMDKSGVDKILAFPGGAPCTEYWEKNDGVADAMRMYPDRIMGFCWVNPHFGPEKTANTIDRYIGMGFKGIKLNPPMDGYSAGNQRLLSPVLDKAREYKVPVIFHTGNSQMASPTLVGELGRQYPDVTIIMGHMGLLDSDREAAIAVKNADNLFLETSVCTWMDHHFAPSVKSVGTKKVIYGSDHPYSPFGLEIDKLVKHAPRYTGWTKEDLKMILSGNIRKILGL